MIPDYLKSKIETEMRQALNNFVGERIDENVKDNIEKAVLNVAETNLILPPEITISGNEVTLKWPDMDEFLAFQIVS